MFDGVPDQFHQFIASSRASSLSLPLSFPLPHASSPRPPPPPPPLTSLSFPAFDLYPPHHLHHLQHPPPHFLQPLHQPPQSQKDIVREEIGGESSLVPVNLGVHHRDRSELAEVATVDDDHQWASDEVLALFRIRSSMENWFPEFTWEHVSRKLAELGFRRSAEECKAKFEEESIRSYTPTSASYPKNDRLLSELEELCNSNHGDHQNNPQLIAADKSNNDKVGKLRVEEEEEDKIACQMIQDFDGANSGNELRATVNDAPEENYKKAATDDEDHINRSSSKGKKRKRSQEERLEKYELFKGLCESVVRRLMAQQEEMHSKLLEGMVRREKEMVEREEAWKRQEMERMNKELDARAHEQAIAGNRQATIIEFLKKFTSFDGDDDQNPHLLSNSPSPCSLAEPNSSNPNDNSSTSHMGTHKPSHVGEVPTSSSLENPNRSTCSSSFQSTPTKQDPSSVSATMAQTESRSNPPTLTNITLQNPSPLNTHQKTNHGSQSLASNAAKDQDLGKRWPRDEVQALINLRCSLYSATSNEDHKLEGSNNNNNKAPLWERISQKMLELGYERSAKRCKEKWENINKYFRKTKDNDKKRSLDSRTCPYFHQLSHLYSQGKLAAPAAAPPADEPLPETSTHDDSSGAGGNKGVANQVAPAANFEF